MRRHAVARRAGFLVLLVPLAASVGAIPSSAPLQAARAATVVRPASFAVGGAFHDVAATSGRNAWAVGLTGILSSNSKTTIAHWNGAVWRRVPSPATAAGAALEGVTATSARSAWAVGCTGCFSARPQFLIESWNGTAWRRVPGPGFGKQPGVLAGVAASSARSAWAVGFSETIFSRGPQTVIMRWNGTTWNRVTSPNPPGGGILTGVAATSARSAWAVGSTSGFKTLILHWNGSAWKHIPGASLPRGSAELDGVAATSARSAWAVGCTRCLSSRPKTLIERWNGSVWRRVASPTPACGATVYSLAVNSARNAWAVGYTGGVSDQTPRPVILHWNGASWRQVPTRNAGSASLYAVAVTSAGNAWAVGHTGSFFTAKPKTVILRWNGRVWG